MGLDWLLGIIMFLELIIVLEFGLIMLKFFLVEVVGGILMFKLIYGLFGDVCFCLIGGIIL